eukprot:scaffold206161_cov17-Tisochrysis_lutea.AAC.1
MHACTSTSPNKDNLDTLKSDIGDLSIFLTSEANTRKLASLPMVPATEDIWEQVGHACQQSQVEGPSPSIVAIQGAAS